MREGSRSSLACLLAIATAGALVPADRLEAQSINQRNTTVEAVISGSRNLYDGRFSATGTSSVCGEVPRESSMTGMASFVIEYPYDDPLTAPVQSIAFGSAQLVAATNRTTQFRLSLSVRLPNGSSPHAYVLNTDSGVPKASGVATRSTVGNQLTLKVVGQNEMGERIDLTVVCT